jgi:hypothetical protein
LVRDDGLLRESDLLIASEPLSHNGLLRDNKGSNGGRIATVRRVLWTTPNLSISRSNPENVEIPAVLLQRLIEAVCYTP